MAEPVPKPDFPTLLTLECPRLDYDHCLVSVRSPSSLGNDPVIRFAATCPSELVTRTCSFSAARWGNIIRSSPDNCGIVAETPSST